MRPLAAVAVHYVSLATACENILNTPIEFHWQSSIVRIVLK